MEVIAREWENKRTENYIHPGAFSELKPKVSNVKSNLIQGRSKSRSSDLPQMVRNTYVDYKHAYIHINWISWD